MPTEKCEQNGEKKKPVSSVVNYNKTTVWIGWQRNNSLKTKQKFSTLLGQDITICEMCSAKLLAVNNFQNFFHVKK